MRPESCIEEDGRCHSVEVQVVGVVGSGHGRVKCTKRRVQIAERTARYRSNRAGIVQSTVGIALPSAKGVHGKTVVL